MVFCSGCLSSSTPLGQGLPDWFSSFLLGISCSSAWIGSCSIWSAQASIFRPSHAARLVVPPVIPASSCSARLKSQASCFLLSCRQIRRSSGLCCSGLVCAGVLFAPCWFVKKKGFVFWLLRDLVEEAWPFLFPTKGTVRSKSKFVFPQLWNQPKDWFPSQAARSWFSFFVVCSSRHWFAAACFCSTPDISFSAVFVLVQLLCHSRSARQVQAAIFLCSNMGSQPWVGFLSDLLRGRRPVQLMVTRPAASDVYFLCTWVCQAAVDSTRFAVELHSCHRTRIRSDSSRQRQLWFSVPCKPKSVSCVHSVWLCSACSAVFFCLLEFFHVLRFSILAYFTPRRKSHAGLQPCEYSARIWAYRWLSLKEKCSCMLIDFPGWEYCRWTSGMIIESLEQKF
jgi:hypothetical protein